MKTQHKNRCFWGALFLIWHLWIVLELRKVPGTLSRALGIVIVAELLIGLTATYLFQPSAVFFGLPIGMVLAV